jgi:hypothetical protein
MLLEIHPLWPTMGAQSTESHLFQCLTTYWLTTNHTQLTLQHTNTDTVSGWLKMTDETSLGIFFELFGIDSLLPIQLHYFDFSHLLECTADRRQEICDEQL